MALKLAVFLRGTKIPNLLNILGSHVAHWPKPILLLSAYTFLLWAVTYHPMSLSSAVDPMADYLTADPICSSCITGSHSFHRPVSVRMNCLFEHGPQCDVKCRDVRKRGSREEGAEDGDSLLLNMEERCVFPLKLILCNIVYPHGYVHFLAWDGSVDSNFSKNQNFALA